MGLDGGLWDLWTNPIAWVPLAMILAFVALVWPIGWQGQFTVRRLVGASADRIWSVYHVNLDDPDSASLHPNVVSQQPVVGNPNVVELVLDASKGHGTHLVTVRSRILTDRRAECYEAAHFEIDGKPMGLGIGDVERLLLTAHPAGTLVDLSWHGQIRSLWHYIGLRLAFRRYLRKIWQLCEFNRRPRNSGVSKGQVLNFGLSAAVIVGLALWAGWQIAFSLTAVIVLHEFGHWLAMRLSGHPAPRIVPIPFLGAMTVPNHPYRSQLETAFCFLMGPGFSLIPAILAYFVAIAMGVPDLSQAADADGAMRQFSPTEVRALYVLQFVIVCGIVNVIQLLPVLPLDGGHTLRSIMESIHGGWARVTLIALTALGFLSGFLFGDLILAGVLLLGLLQAWQMNRDSNAAGSQPRPMKAAAIGLIGLCYVATFTLHIWVIISAVQSLGILGYLFA